MRPRLPTPLPSSHLTVGRDQGATPNPSPSIDSKVKQLVWPLGVHKHSYMHKPTSKWRTLGILLSNNFQLDCIQWEA